MLAATSQFVNALLFGALAAGTVAHMVAVPAVRMDPVDAMGEDLSRDGTATQAIRSLAVPADRAGDEPRVLSPTSPLLSVPALPGPAKHDAPRDDRQNAVVVQPRRGARVVPPLAASKTVDPSKARAGKAPVAKPRAKGALDTSERSALGVGAVPAKNCASGQRHDRRQRVCVGPQARKGAKAVKAKARRAKRPR